MKYASSLIIIYWFASYALSVVALECCDPGVLVVNLGYLTRHCEDKKKLALNCTGSTHMLNNDWSEYSHFMVQRDQLGEYVDAYGFGYIARSPYFCIGQMKGGYTEQLQEVAFTCFANRIWYPDIHSSYTPADAPFRDRLLPLLMVVLNFASAVTLAITAFIYGLLQDLQDSQGICTFHFVLSTGFLHAGVFYYMTMDTTGLLPSLCITNLYLNLYTLLCSFTWCAIMGYNSWIHVKNIQRIIDEDKLLRWYRYIGYGLPFLMVMISNLYAHANRLYTEFRFEMQCQSHQSRIMIITIALPILVASVANGFFFVDIQRHLWNSPALELRSEKSTLRKLKYRLFLNGKLFFILGISWIALFIFISIDYVSIDWSSSSIVVFSQYLTILLVSGEGVPIFLLLVFFRKRVLKGASRRFNVCPTRWRNAIDSEIAEDDVNDTVGHSFTFEKENSTEPETKNAEVKDKTASGVESYP